MDWKSTEPYTTFKPRGFLDIGEEETSSQSSQSSESSEAVSPVSGPDDLPVSELDDLRPSKRVRHGAAGFDFGAAMEYQRQKEQVQKCLNELHNAISRPTIPADIAFEPFTPREREPYCNLVEFQKCCKDNGIWKAFGEMEEALEKDSDITEQIAEEEKMYSEEQTDPLPCKKGGGGGGVNQMGGAIHGRIFSIRRPSIRKFLMILLCCLKNVAATCKFAADIAKLILAILTIGATIGVSSFILYYLAAAIQALGCAGWSAIAGTTADLCSCAVGTMAAGTILGPSAAQLGMISLGTTVVAGSVVAYNRNRVQRILQLVQAGAAAREARGQARNREQEEAVAAQINSLLNQGSGVLFGQDGYLSRYGKQVLEYLCDETFRENVNAYLQTGVPSDLALLIHELSIIMFLEDGRRPDGLIGQRAGDSTADLNTLNELIRRAATMSGGATIAAQMAATGADMRSALDAFGERYSDIGTWRGAISPMTNFVMFLVNNIRSAGEAGVRFFRQVRELFVARILARLRADGGGVEPDRAAVSREVSRLRDEEVTALLLGLASSLPQSRSAMGLSPDLSPAGTGSAGGGYPTRRRRRTKRRSKSKRRTKSRRRRTLRKTSKRTRKTNVRRKFTRKSTKKLSRRRSRKLSRK